jgi:thiamine-phosphate pyrophosphorylase
LQSDTADHARRAQSHRLRGLYVIIDPEVAGERDLLEIARHAIEGGARLIQYRDKTREKGMQLPVARALQALCCDAGALFFVNDHADLALAVEADGVHLGQRDLPVAVVRAIVPDTMLIGASTNNLAEARQAVADGADYVSVGRLFPTGSKSDTRPATLEMLHAVKAAVPVPVCAIGGIDHSNIRSVIDTGADMAAVISAVVASEDVREATRRLVDEYAVQSAQNTGDLRELPYPPPQAPP